MGWQTMALNQNLVCPVSVQPTSEKWMLYFQMVEKNIL